MVLDVSLTEALAALAPPVVLAELNYLLSPAPGLKHNSAVYTRRTSLGFCSTRETRHVQRDSEFNC